jgi:small subunit ribosomal protein S2
MMTPFGSTQTRETAWQPHHGLHRPPAHTTLSALLAAGAHLGHNAARMNPHFVPYAYGTRAGLTVIDLDATLPLLRRAAALVRAVAARDGTVVFIGTRPDLLPAVRAAARRLGPLGFYIGDRWVPGTLTNRLQRFGADAFRRLRGVPDLAIVLNPRQNAVALRELTTAQVPTVGLVDSDVDPRVVMYPVPANDESTRTAELVAGVLSIAGREGLNIGRQMRGQQPWSERDNDEDDEQVLVDTREFEEELGENGEEVLAEGVEAEETEVEFEEALREYSEDGVNAPESLSGRA